MPIEKILTLYIKKTDKPSAWKEGAWELGKSIKLRTGKGK